MLPTIPVHIHNAELDDDRTLILEESPQQTKEGLVIRVRRKPKSTRRTYSELHCNSRPAITPTSHFLTRHSPILKPKTTTTNRHIRTPSSSVLRTPGVHLALPTTRPQPTFQLYKFPTMLMLRLLESKGKRSAKKVTPSPSLKYVNLQCPVDMTHPKRPNFTLKRRNSQTHKANLSAISDYEARKETSGLHARQITPGPGDGENGDSGESGESEGGKLLPSMKAGRKVVFTKRERGIEETQDPDYCEGLGAYYA